MEIQPLNAAHQIGAEVYGIELNGDLAENALLELQNAWKKHKVLIFPNQTASDAEQVAFSQCFGELEKFPLTSVQTSAHPEIFRVSNVDESNKRRDVEDDTWRYIKVTQSWHIDSSYRAVPSRGSLLRALELTRQGGDLKNNFGVPVRYTARTLIDGLTHPSWSWNFLRNGVPQFGNLASSTINDPEIQAALMTRQMDGSFSWDDLAHLREIWPHKLLVKGLSRSDDAKRCESMGIDGVILSNHGGRQLDTAIAPFQALPSTHSAVDIPVLIDSGIRRGSDVVKAIAAGATAVLLGRATLYGLAAKGSEGVDAVLEIFRDEMDRTLAQIGCPDIEQVDTTYLWPRGNRFQGHYGSDAAVALENLMPTHR
ncbi:alpha-hydroxy-acid oxidizing protein [Burkholderia cenocepacia]|uniref:alpha-hydroxy-acid oxidizing protein n=1 Tax=Burkholderia cepacia complex TaxID=87882 RepID=UPI001B9D7C33|nr:MULTISPECIES: alpha-hydroxy-acid oxidizing protein [Burkholderia cepacia complex]MBR8158468.1 alpha-hydroxy-acid oxidizing protein [Burkholderia cenocepacia]MDF3079849.1 alpha-hydroxy-acid oxidizing protein [Burkholderia sola]MEB2607269.1 alpha-hydroxy-acid oxidizing protein [Burkholderia cenocepacia]WJN72186.1 L-lactate dehydrogenase [Burkholderia anthina]